MALEMAGGAFLTVVFEKLFEQLASPELRKNSIASKLKMLKQKLEKVKVYLEDAEDKQLSDKKVKEWLDNLKHVVFMADDLVEQINNSKNEKIPKRKVVVRAIKSLYRRLAKTVQGDIDLILTELDGLLELATALNLEHIGSSADLNRRPSPRIVAPLREKSHIYGREVEKKKILEMLLSKEDKMIVLPIVGMGGIGKTTLAQLVYNDKQVEEHSFSLKAWVTVSIEFDFCRIMKEILQKVYPGTSCSNVDDPNELQQLMQVALREKKFPIVLDDVWDENTNNWDLLMTNFAAGGPGSRVIITTRSRVVGSMANLERIHVLKEVQEDHCWSIFVHHAFDGAAKAGLELERIGRRIVQKCKGVPLAVKSMGCLLRPERDPRKWENILESRVWSQNHLGVLPSLWLSYRYLSSSLKQCFAYCSIFPQDHHFEKKTMVLLWMAEGFIRSNEEGKSMEELGEEYFDDLVSRSLFQRSSEDDDTYVVHDLVHDLARFVYGNFCFSICENDDLKKFSTRTRHLTHGKDVTYNDLLNSLSTSKHLRNLMDIRIGERRMVDVDDFVTKMVLNVRCLRALTMSLQSSKLCHSLGDLKMLRYLNLYNSEIEELPGSFCSLFHLQTLILSWCVKLTQLPTDLPRKLTKLRYLNIDYTRVRKMPPKMGSLKELRVLRGFVVGEGDGSGCSTLKDLGELQHLGRLRITELQNVDNLEVVENVRLRDKAEMKELDLTWGYNVTSDMRDKAVDVLDALQPHRNLEKLEVGNYPGSSFPKWVGETSFSKMVFVHLNGCTSSVLPPLGQLPSLRELHIEGFQRVKKIGKELLYGNDTNSSITPFPSLEILQFRNMNVWKEWSFVGNESARFPHLKELQFYACPQLESINWEGEDEDEMAEMESTTLHHHCPSLSKLEIEFCDLLVRRYQKDNGERWLYISHIPFIKIRRKTLWVYPIRSLWFSDLIFSGFRISLSNISTSLRSHIFHMTT